MFIEFELVNKGLRLYAIDDIAILAINRDADDESILWLKSDPGAAQYLRGSYMTNRQKLLLACSELKEKMD